MYTCSYMCNLYFHICAICILGLSLGEICDIIIYSKLLITKEEVKYMGDETCGWIDSDDEIENDDK